MPAQILYEADGNQIVVPIDRDELTIGRDPSNDLVIGQPYVSRWHAKVYMADNGWRVMDLDSKSGIQINDRETVDGALEHGDRIFIEEMCLTFMDEDGAVPPQSTASVVSLTPAAANPGTVFRKAVDSGPAWVHHALGRSRAWPGSKVREECHSSLASHRSWGKNSLKSWSQF